jgi:hypothetical protein
MYHHHGVYHKKPQKNGVEKDKFCNALHAETSKAAMLKFSARIPITIPGSCKKNGGINVSSGTRAHSFGHI